MDRLLNMDVEQFISQMRPEIERALRQVGEAVNKAPTGNAISGSEIQVRDVMREFNKTVYEKAMQMRIDSTESSFSPSAGLQGQSGTKQGVDGSQR